MNHISYSIINKAGCLLITMFVIGCTVNCKRSSVEGENRIVQDSIYFSSADMSNNNLVIGVVKDYINYVEDSNKYKDKINGEYNLFYQMVIRRRDYVRTEIKLSCVEATSFAYNHFPASGFMIVSDRVVLLYTGLEMIDKEGSIQLIQKIRTLLPGYISEEPTELMMQRVFPARLIEIEGSETKVSRTDFDGFNPDQSEAPLLPLEEIVLPEE